MIARTLLLLGLLITSLFVGAQTPTPLSANGRLKVVNRQLTNETGKAIQLRGMSTHGLQWFDNCYTQASVQVLATNWGTDILRAAMYVDEGGYLTNQAGLRAKINQIVDWTAQAGIYCIIDWHVLNPGNPNERLSYAIDFFRTMAQTHAGKKNVIYEICNEPNGVTWAQIKSYADQVIPVIRQYDPEAIILVGTPQWCQRPQDVLSDPLSGANAYNIMYTFHFYAASHFFQGDVNSVVNSLPLFCSEWGTSTFSGDGNLDFNNGQAWLDLMAGSNPAGQKISWCNWTFSDAGQSSAALNPGSCGAQQWNNTSASGTWVKNRILNPADDFGPSTPSVAIVSPTNNTTISIGTNLAINASVYNATATAVEFYNGATLLGTDATSPYSWTIATIQQGTYSLTAKALVSSGNLTSPVVQVTAAPAPNQPPSVSLTSPTNNAAFPTSATITVAANANDTDGSIARVEFYNGTTKLGEDATLPYTFIWTGMAAGTYTLTAKAIDNQNATSTSTASAVIVYNPGSPDPTADILGPDCAFQNAVQVFEVNAGKSLNATNYSWWFTGSSKSITTLQPGKVSIDFGSNFTGGQLCVGINYSASPWYAQYCKNVAVCSGNPPTNPANQAPIVSLTSPVTNATFTAPATVALTASASDSDGNVTKVEFYNGSAKIGESTGSPYQFSWNSVSAGTYTLTAKAIDDQNATSTSAAVTITVKTATTPPTNPTADIIGPDCAAKNAVHVFELNAGKLANATSFSWWFTGSSQSITPTQPGKATYNFGPWFTGGQVCVGVNYSAAPWYAQYCKNITVCAPAARVGIADIADNLVFPNPTTDRFSFVAERDIQSMNVADDMGRERIKLGAAKAGQTITFGEQLSAGTYLLQIHYQDQQRRVIKLLKVNRQ
ncbi:cellulase family glycosylhydrolase [Spirosoma sp.]|uniref:cellulase family glycosylhydrolase n=1 Tax=Spirosoma sp. TaxID=1899569 RepID=UPI003B3BB5B1